jgi:hypothetical protein
MYKSIYIRIYVCVCVHTCIYVYAYAYTYVCIRLYILDIYNDMLIYLNKIICAFKALFLFMFYLIYQYRACIFFLFIILLFYLCTSVNSYRALKRREVLIGPAYASFLIGSSRYRSPGEVHAINF